MFETLEEVLSPVFSTYKMLESKAAVKQATVEAAVLLDTGVTGYYRSWLLE